MKNVTEFFLKYMKSEYKDPKDIEEMEVKISFRLEKAFQGLEGFSFLNIEV